MRQISGVASRRFEFIECPMPSTGINRQSGMAAAVALRSAAAIQPSFSPHNTECGCLISRHAPFQGTALPLD